MNDREQFVSSRAGTAGLPAPSAEAHGVFALVTGLSGGRGIRTHEDGTTVLAVFKTAAIGH